MVVWNALGDSAPMAADTGNPVAVPEADFDKDLRLIITSPFIAAREAGKVWTDGRGRRWDSEEGHVYCDRKHAGGAGFCHA